MEPHLNIKSSKNKADCKNYTANKTIKPSYFLGRLYVNIYLICFVTINLKTS